MSKVKITIVESKCRGGYCKTGDAFIVEDLCPPICHELWNILYPSVYTLLNGGDLDCGTIRSEQFDAVCPDQGRVRVHVEAVDE